jgi:hypothetical protein
MEEFSAENRGSVPIAISSASRDIPPPLSLFTRRGALLVHPLRATPCPHAADGTGLRQIKREDVVPIDLRVR